jgi:hypothetical protein
MDRLKLVALDAEDLAIVSAHVQDAVTRVADLRWLPDERRFLMVMNRYAWERASGREAGERRRSVLNFDRVTKAEATRIRRDAPDAVVSLLAVTFEPAEPPAGTVTLTFAGGGAIRLTVECIEARLADVGGAWAARGRPAHDLFE